MKEAKGVFFIKNWSKKKRKSLKTKEKQSKIPRRATLTSARLETFNAGFVLA